MQGVLDYVPIRETSAEAVRGERSSDIAFIGTTSRLAKSRDLTTASGRFLVERDVTRLENVCVIGPTVRNRLFGVTNPIGRNVRIDSEYYLVVGVLTTDDIRERSSTDRHVYVPWSTMLARHGSFEIRSEAGAFEASDFDVNEIDVLVAKSSRRQSAKVLRETLTDWADEEPYRIEVELGDE